MILFWKILVSSWFFAISIFGIFLWGKLNL